MQWAYPWLLWLHTVCNGHAALYSVHLALDIVHWAGISSVHYCTCFSHCSESYIQKYNPWISFLCTSCFPEHWKQSKQNQVTCRVFILKAQLPQASKERFPTLLLSKLLLQLQWTVQCSSWRRGCQAENTVWVERPASAIYSLHPHLLLQRVHCVYTQPPACVHNPK